MIWLYATITSTALALVVIRYLVLKIKSAYTRLWLEMGIVDWVVLLRWDVKSISKYCEEMNITVYMPHPSGVRHRKLSPDEVVRSFGHHLVRGIHTPDGAAKMKVRVREAMRLTLLENQPFKQGDMQRVVENIWNQRGK